MILRDVCLLAANTARSKAYVQMMAKHDMLPNSCIVYVESKKELEQKPSKVEAVYEDYFDINEPIITTLNQCGIPYSVIENKDINSCELMDAIADHKEKYMIYSGYGGGILKKQLFQLGKQYIHVHAGKLPQFRGSTTVYYSYLKEKKVGASAIFLSETIDTGDIIFEKEFEVDLKQNVSIDYVYEPWIRAMVLIGALKELSEPGFDVKKQESMTGAETYYIIHPVLKHLALLGMEREIND